MPHLSTLLIQMAVIITLSRLIGRLFGKIRQPQVMGEMIAGIMLGPSLLGWVAPGISAALFPTASLGLLNSISQIGLLLFMFLVGLELNPHGLQGRRHLAVITSHVSIILPFLLGTLTALYLYPRLSDDRIKFTHFALFLGIAMSITAFPVLARILTERNLLRSHVGSVAIACAAVDDVTAWCILAGVILLVRSSDMMAPLWLTLFGSGAYILAMLLIGRRALLRFELIYKRHGRITQTMLAAIFVLVFASAWVTEHLGIHALFGAFLFGSVMPKSQDFVHGVSEKLRDVTIALMLPLFFAFTGLRTSIGLLGGTEMWFYCALIIAVAIAGKFGGAALSARLAGMSWREAGAIGVLMNTRGLMELVVLNIGLDIGVISPAVFTMMVFMALITTFMTMPLLELIYPAKLLSHQSEDSKSATAA